MIKTDIPSSITKCLIEQTVIIYVEIFKTCVIFLSVISMFFLRHTDLLTTSLHEIKRKISKSTVNICICNLDIFSLIPTSDIFSLIPMSDIFSLILMSDIFSLIPTNDIFSINKLMSVTLRRLIPIKTIT